MAHFAEINADNQVLRVIVIADEHEANGPEWCRGLLGGTWIQTSYNAETNGFRKHYAGAGYTYDSVRDEFVSPQPFESWTLDSNNDWQPPTPRPEGDYMWDEETLSWLERNVS